MSARTTWLAALTLTLLAGADRAAARRHRARARAGVDVVLVPPGLYVGGGVVGNAILGQSGGPELLESGGGLTLFAGFRLHPRLALEVGWIATFHNPAPVFGGAVDYLVLDGFTGDARVYPGDGAAAGEPYLQGGLGVYLLDSTYFGAQSVGTGFQLGGGYDLAIAPSATLGVRALYRGIAMGPPDRDQTDTFISAVTLDGNVRVTF